MDFFLQDKRLTSFQIDRNKVDLIAGDGEEKRLAS
jgi:hypothetical protein